MVDAPRHTTISTMRRLRFIPSKLSAQTPLLVMCIMLFTLYLLSPVDYPEGPYCLHRKHRTTGSPVASRPPWTRTLGGSEGHWRRPLSHLNSWEWRAMLPPLSTNSWMTRLRAMALASATWHLATVQPGSALWWMLRDSHQG